MSSSRQTSRCSTSRQSWFQALLPRPTRNYPGSPLLADLFSECTMTSRKSSSSAYVSARRSLHLPSAVKLQRCRYMRTWSQGSCHFSSAVKRYRCGQGSTTYPTFKMSWSKKDSMWLTFLRVMVTMSHSYPTEPKILASLQDQRMKYGGWAIEFLLSKATQSSTTGF